MSESLEVDTELDDIEYSIPTIDKQPSLQSILYELDFDVEVESEKLNFASTNSNTQSSFLRCNILEKISSQISSAANRINAGSATSIAVNKMISIGTSHGSILHFDNEQNLRWAYKDKNGQGTVSDLVYNYDCIRLLAGYVRGLVIMFETKSGNILRNLVGVISPNAGVLNLKWTSRPDIALCSDSGGSVWSLSFTRKLGVRGYSSKCLFTGSRGEICAIEPFVPNNDSYELKSFCIIALATLSKYFIIKIRPRLEIIKSYSLNGPPTCLPLLSWQMVLIQALDTTRRLYPILAVARGNNLYFRQVILSRGQINVMILRHVQLSYNFVSLHWLGPKYIACIDTSEILHLIDVRSNNELGSVDLANVDLAYASAQFKGLATGGNVSPALALAGTHACYNSVVVYDSQLYTLGAKNLYMVSIRSWSERISYLVNNQNWTEACDLAIEKYRKSIHHERCKLEVKKKIIDLFREHFFKKQNINKYLAPVMKCLIEINELDLLWEVLWDRLDSPEQFLSLITHYIECELLKKVSPNVAQALVDFWVTRSPAKVEDIILNLDWTCLDLHQALTVARKYKLYKSQIYLNSNAFGDYTISLIELIPLINKEDRLLGNCLLVYISNCLNGRGYPHGVITFEQIPVVKQEVLQCLISVHSNKYAENVLPYPYLRELLKFNAKEILNIFSDVFEETKFNLKLETSFRQRIINILMEIITSERDLYSQIGYFFNFMIKQILLKHLPEDYIISGNIFDILMVDKIDEETTTEHLEREQAWLKLLSYNLIKHISLEKQLELAEKAKFYCVVEYILESLEKYDNILKCYLNNLNYNKEVFIYIEKYTKEPKRIIYPQVLDNLEQLLKIDSNAIVKIIIENYSDKIESILKLNIDSNAMYVLLKHLLEYDIELSREHYEFYLNLLCKEDPKQVKSFLQKYERYNIEKALEIVASHNFTECCAYLYEKKGDYKNAFHLLMDYLKNTTNITSNDNIPEPLAFEISALCTRASVILPKEEQENYWFILLKEILQRPELILTTRKILRIASQYVDSPKLVQLILSSETQASLGDVKDLLIDILKYARYENILIHTTSRIFKHDLYCKFTSKRKKASHGIWIPFVKCIVCHQRLYNQTDTVIFSYCTHTAHKKCINDAVDVNVDCPRCVFDTNKQKPSILTQLNFKI